MCFLHLAGPKNHMMENAANPPPKKPDIGRIANFILSQYQKSRTAANAEAQKRTSAMSAIAFSSVFSNMSKGPQGFDEAIIERKGPTPENSTCIQQVSACMRELFPRFSDHLVIRTTLPNTR